MIFFLLLFWFLLCSGVCIALLDLRIQNELKQSCKDVGTFCRINHQGWLRGFPLSTHVYGLLQTSKYNSPC